MSASESSQQLVIFSLGVEEYALPITQVQEIIRYTEPRAVASEDPSIEGVISLRRGNAANWVPIVGLTPVGTWQLSLPDTPEVRARFTEGRILDVVFAISVAGTAPAWPA